MLNGRASKLVRAEDLEAIDLWADVEAEFDAFSRMAWNAVVLQTFKVRSASVQGRQGWGAG